MLLQTTVLCIWKWNVIDFLYCLAGNINKHLNSNISGILICCWTGTRLVHLLSPLRWPQTDMPMQCLNLRFTLPEERQITFNKFLDIIEGSLQTNGIFYLQKQNSSLTTEFQGLLGRCLWWHIMGDRSGLVWSYGLNILIEHFSWQIIEFFFCLNKVLTIFIPAKISKLKIGRPTSAAEDGQEVGFGEGMCPLPMTGRS